MRRVRQVAGVDRRAELLGERERRVERVEHAGIDADALAGELLGHAEADPVEASSPRAARSLPGKPIDVLSRSSLPTMWRSSSAASATSRVSGPAWSSDEAKAIMP